MPDTKNILVLRGPYGSDPGALVGLRDYVLESVRLGAVVLDDSATLEVMELPPLLGVEVQEREKPPEKQEPEDVPGPGPEPEPLKSELSPPVFIGSRGKEKLLIWHHMQDYRTAHGLGCWKAVAEQAGKGVDDELLRGMLIGSLSPPLSVWRRIDTVLTCMEAREKAEDA